MWLQILQNVQLMYSIVKTVNQLQALSNYMMCQV